MEGLGDTRDAAHYDAHVLLFSDRQHDGEVERHGVVTEELKQANKRGGKLLGVQQFANKTLRLLSEFILLLAFMLDLN